MTRHLVVIGAGVTGLAAAWEASAHDGVTATVLEAAERMGGKVRTSAFDLPTGPLVIDEGPDNFLAREPEVVDLCVELGLADRLVQPSVGRAKVWVPDAAVPGGGELRWFPTRHVLGAPIDIEDLASTGILAPDGLARVAAEADRTDAAPDADLGIGSFLADRYGPELVARIAGPLIGGINAGDVDELSLRAVTPQLAAAAAEGASLTEALRRRLAATRRDGPVFQALLGGTGELVDELVAQLSARGVQIRTATPVTGLHPGVDGRVVVELVDGTLDVDGVVVTTPAPVAARLLHRTSPAAARELDRIDHVTATFATFAFRREDLPFDLDASGVLVPRDAGLLMTATSFGSLKWPHWDDGLHVILRVASGHRHDDRPTRMDDDELVAALRSDLATVFGIGATPAATRVSRWDPGFAQYRVGHLELVERVHAALAADVPALRVAGADLGGLGLPACVRQGRAAARTLLT